MVCEPQCLTYQTSDTCFLTIAPFVVLVLSAVLMVYGGVDILHVGWTTNTGN